MQSRLIQFRNYVSGDPSGHCSLDRQTREKIYASLPPLLQALLPNKALAEYEIAEDNDFGLLNLSNPVLEPKPAWYTFMNFYTLSTHLD